MVMLGKSMEKAVIVKWDASGLKCFRGVGGAHMYSGWIGQFCLD